MQAFIVYQAEFLRDMVRRNSDAQVIQRNTLHYQSFTYILSIAYLRSIGMLDGCPTAYKPENAEIVRHARVLGATNQNLAELPAARAKDAWPETAPSLLEEGRPSLPDFPLQRPPSVALEGQAGADWRSVVHPKSETVK
jgi:hypothetical protein